MLLICGGIRLQQHALMGLAEAGLIHDRVAAETEAQRKNKRAEAGLMTAEHLCWCRQRLPIGRIASSCDGRTVFAMMANGQLKMPRMGYYFV